MPWYTGYSNNNGDIQEYKTKMINKQLIMKDELYNELEYNILSAKKNKIKNFFIQLPLPEPYKDIPIVASNLSIFLNKTEQEINKQ